MRSLGLKVNITGTLVLLLTIAVLLGNGVIVLFWQRGMVMGEVKHVQTVAALWSGMLDYREGAGEISVGDLDQICKAVGSACRGVTVFDGSTLVSATAYQEYPSLEEAVRLAASSRKKVVLPSTITEDREGSGEKRLIVALPVTLRNRPSMGFGLALSMQTVSQVFQQHRKIVIIYMLVNIVLLTIVGLFRMIKLVVRPIERLVKTSEAYDNADGLAFLGQEAGSEIGQLSLALNRMLARIEEDREKLRLSVKSLEQANRQLIDTQKEMVRAEKLAAVGRLSAGLAHEIGNPIGIVQGYLELLEHSDLAAEDRVQFSRRAIAELQRINNLIHQLLDFSRASSQAPEPVAVQSLLTEVIDMFVAQKRAPEISFVPQCLAGEDVVVANAVEMRQVFLNCLLNAADSIQEMGEGHPGRIVVSCRCDREDVAVIHVVFADNGQGIAADHLETIFDPFFTTKAPGKGTGLGLSVSCSIVEAAGGRIWAESHEEGAEIHIELPAAQ
jgi:hypothetical protein